MHNERVINREIDCIVTALCADYRRRAEVISQRSAPYNVIMEYRFLNYRILSAAVEVVGSRDALCFIEEIGNRTGYCSSNQILLSERSYKRRKREVRLNIAKRLSLI